jgi:hypothetical protein
MSSARRFPPPWSIDEYNDACFIVKDADGQALGYFYFEEEPGRRSAAKLLTKDEARRFAVNLPSCRSCCASRKASPSCTPQIVTIGRAVPLPGRAMLGVRRGSVPSAFPPATSVPVRHHRGYFSPGHAQKNTPGFAPPVLGPPKKNHL